MNMHMCNPIHVCWYCKIHGMIAESDPKDKSLLRYFVALPRAALDRLYTNGWAVQGIIRTLPEVARLYTLRLVMPSALGDGIPESVVDAWPTPDGKRQHQQALGMLKRLHLLEKFAQPTDGGGETSNYRLRRDFATQLLDCLRVGGVLAEDAEVGADGAAGAVSESAAPVTAAVLEKHARSRWEKVLQAILTPPKKQVPLYMTAEHATLQTLLQEAELLTHVEEAMGADDAPPPPAATPRYKMSRDAARFMLLPTNQQVWRVVRAYMELAEHGTPGTRHDTLCFLMRLGLLEIGRGYRIDDSSLGEGQRKTLEDMARFGLAYRPLDDKQRYYATPLAQHLLAGITAENTRGAGASTASASVAEADPTSASLANATSGVSAASGGGFIILETNFRLYGYTCSPLWANLLKQIIKVEFILPNLVVGSLTRESTHAAIDNGISSQDIADFLERNAHARMLARQSEDGGPVMPETVISQVHLWARERHRMQFNHARLYEGFTSVEEFNAVEKYARDTGALLWSRRGDDGHKCSMAVKATAKAEMKQFVQRYRAGV